MLLMFSWGLSTSLLIEARRDAYDHAVENARNLMLLIERDIARNIGYDLSLQNVVDGITDPELAALPRASVTGCCSTARRPASISGRSS